jgi:hypothetical protein
MGRIPKIPPSLHLPVVAVNLPSIASYDVLVPAMAATALGYLIGNCPGYTAGSICSELREQTARIGGQGVDDVPSLLSGG